MDDEGAVIVDGHIKWFSSQRDFGFVVVNDELGDILLHGNVIRNYGLSSIATGLLVRVSIRRSSKGYQVAEIIDVKHPEDSSGLMEQRERFPVVDLSRTPVEPARVKWFDPVKGYGFVNVFGSNKDVFLHVDVVKKSGLFTVFAGEAIAVQIVDGVHGPTAARLLGWEQQKPILSFQKVELVRKNIQRFRGTLGLAFD